MQLTARVDGRGERRGKRERASALSAPPDARRRDTIVAARLDGGRGVYINRRHVDRPSGSLTGVTLLHAHTLVRYASERGGFSHIDLRRESLHYRLRRQCNADRPGRYTHPRRMRGGGEGSVRGTVSGRRYSRKVCTSTRIAFGNIASNIYSRHTFSSDAYNGRYKISFDTEKITRT